MVKCLNIGKNIGKPIYRSISNIVLVVLTRCGLTLSSILQKTFKRPRYTSNEVNFYSSFGERDETRAKRLNVNASRACGHTSGTPWLCSDEA